MAATPVRIKKVRIRAGRREEIGPADEAPVKQRDQSYEGRKTAVAGDEAVGKNGDEPFSGRVDDPAARYSGCIAAKAHSHGKGLFSAGFAALEGTVQIICDPGQITKIFQKGKEREENGHGRKHDRDNPGQYPVYTQNQNPVEPLGRIDCHKSSGKFFLKGEKREESRAEG